MNETKEIESHKSMRPPLALHIRSLRQWHGEHGLPQADLAFLSGIPLRLLQTYEKSYALSKPVVTLVALSLALDVPIERLIAPRIQEKLRAAIVERRQALQLLASHRKTPPCRRLI